MNNKISILTFSGRKNGNCANIGSFVSNYYNTDLVSMYIIDGIQPCGNCNYECLRPNVNCPNVSKEYKTIMDAICNSDLVYFVIPNFCGFPCASYFAFNERSVGYFNTDRALMKQYMDVKKRFIIVSNTEGESFTKPLMQQTNEAPDVLYIKSGKYKKQSIAGDIMDSCQAQADLKAFLDAEH